MRNTDSFDMFFNLVEKFRQQSGIDEPILPRKRKVPQHLEVGTTADYHSVSVQAHYRQFYFEALDLVTTAIVTGPAKINHLSTNYT